jgi:hypothetical protein
MLRGVDRNEIAWTLNPRSSVQLRDLPPSALGNGPFSAVGRSSVLALWLLDWYWGQDLEDFVDGNPAGALEGIELR